MAEQVFPTKGNLIRLKKSLELAKTGYDLLDRKRNILVRETMLLVDRAKEVTSKIESTYSKAYLALQNANIHLGIVDDIAVCVPVDNSVRITGRSIMGVVIPKVDCEKTPLVNTYGYRRTDISLDKAFKRFDEVKMLTAQLAEIESSVFRLAEGIRKTQKRANALKNIVIPRFETQIKTISDMLDEKEREEFSRLNVIKKQVDKNKSKN